jgi:hypothetical protein
MPGVALPEPTGHLQLKDENVQGAVRMESINESPAMSAGSRPVSVYSQSRPASVHSVTKGISGAMEELGTMQNLTIDEARAGYSSDSLSIYSSDSASIFSSASSVYSSAASMYSFDECRLEGLDEGAEVNLDSRLPGRMHYQQRTHAAAVARQQAAPHDAASRERSSLAKKGTYFKNSKLAADLPAFTATLPAWSMVCRAAQASLDCYDNQKRIRRGTYIPADTSNNIKAMIVDDQFIDSSRFIIVSIRGTQLQSLADWVVNKDAKPIKPVGFLDDEENACHAGFLQVAQAMVERVASQLKEHPSLSEEPSLLITGHSAGGAVAALLYSHIISTSVSSNLAQLATKFSTINCVTFGAPPVLEMPSSKTNDDAGVFLAFANEGDPVLRMSNAAYMKSLVKLMTASQGPVAAPAVKVIRRSRGSTVIRAPVAAVLPPWEERPLWATPPASFVNAGNVILLRAGASGCSTASPLLAEELKDVIFSDLAQHTMEMYMGRVKDMALTAMMGWRV